MIENGTQIGEYRIDGLLGQGGMAAVYKAWHLNLHRHEAMKVLSSQMAHDESFVERFLDEPRKVASLEHPNIAAIYTVSNANAAQPFFTMEMVTGGDLADLISDRKRLRLNEALPILRQTAAALDFAHSRGLIHRDIKPANILLKPNKDGYTVKVVDFGISKAMEESEGARLTKTGMFIGTPEYMSPEQAGNGEVVTQHTDQYSLAVMAYEMLCGTPPFRSEKNTSMMSVLMKHVREEPRPIIDYVPDLPAATSNAIGRALAKIADQRFSSCSEFVAAMEGAIEVPPPPIPPKKEVTSSKSTFPALPILLGVLLLAGVAMVGRGLLDGDHQAEQRSDANTISMDISGSNVDSANKIEGPAPVQISVPDLVGKTEPQAREILKAKSLNIDVTTGYSDAFDTQKIMSQYPNVNVPVAKNSIVKVRISLGAEHITAPIPDTPVESTSSTNMTDDINDSDISDIKSRYNSWLQAWQSMNINAYMSYYSPHVKQNRGGGLPSFGYSTMRKRMSGAFRRAGYITISSNDPSIKIEGDRVLLTAHQRYDSKIWWDKGIKRLTWQKENGVWKIIEESFSRSAGGHK